MGPVTKPPIERSQYLTIVLITVALFHPMPRGGENTVGIAQI